MIIHLPREVRLVCLSATVSNADELAAWIGEVRGPTATVVEERRPVELANLYVAHDRANRQLFVVPTLAGGRPNPAGERLDADLPLRGRPDRAAGRAGASPRPAASRWSSYLAAEDLLPAIYFIFSRAGCDDAAMHLLDSGVRLTSPDERAQIRAIAEDRTADAVRRRPRRARLRPLAGRASSSASPPTTPAWCRRSRRRWRPASCRAW